MSGDRDLGSRLARLDPEQRRYTLETLVGRLRDANQPQRLAALFADDAWMRARMAAAGNAQDGVRADLAIAWADVADRRARTIEETPAEPCSLLAALRYALIQTTLNSVAASYSPELLGRAVALGLWRPDLALSTASNVRSGVERLKLYVALLGTHALEGAERARTAKAALEASLALTRDSERAAALEALAPFLVGQALDTALEAAEALKDAAARIRATAKLAWQLDKERRRQVMDKACDALSTIELPKAWIDSVAALLVHMTDEERSESVDVALGVVAEMDGPAFRSAALVTLARALTGELRGSVVRKARELVVGMRDKELAFQLADLFEVLNAPERQALAEEVLPHVLALGVVDHDYDFPRPVGLIALGPHLREQAWATAEAAARELRGPAGVFQLRVEIFIALGRAEGVERAPELIHEAIELARRAGSADLLHKLASQTDGSARRELLEAALAAALAAPNASPRREEPSPRFEALARLGPLLDLELLERALWGAAQIGDDEVRARALISIGLHLESPDRVDLQRRLLHSLASTEKGALRRFAVASILPRLEATVAEEALEKALKLEVTGPFQSERGAALSALAPRLEGAALDMATRAALDLPRALDRAETLVAFAARFTGAALAEIVHAALEAIPRIEGAGHLKANVVRDVAPYLDSSQATWAWDYVLGLDDPRSTASAVSAAITALAPQMRGAAAVRAIDAICARPKGNEKVHALAAVLPNLAGAEQEQARARALAEVVAGGAGEAAIALAPLVTGEERSAVTTAALAALEQIGNREMFAERMAKLAPSLDGPLRRDSLAEAARRAFSIEEPTFAPRLSGLLSQMSRDEVRALLPAARAQPSPRQRARVLAVIRAAVPEDPDLLDEVRAALIDLLLEHVAGPRAAVLELLSLDELLAPPIFTRPQLQSLASAILEICETWRWSP